MPNEPYRPTLSQPTADGDRVVVQPLAKLMRYAHVYLLGTRCVSIDRINVRLRPSRLPSEKTVKDLAEAFKSGEDSIQNPIDVFIPNGVSLDEYEHNPEVTVGVWDGQNRILAG